MLSVDKTATPFNPDANAIKRVPDPHHLSDECEHCGGIVTVENNSIIYSKEYGHYPWIYYCNWCSASVGMHPYTNIPLGTLANREIKEARKDSKASFFKYVKVSGYSRSACYAHLSKALSISPKETHFGLFDVERCNAAKQALIKLTRELSRE